MHDQIWKSNHIKRISYNILGMLTPSSVAGMQLIMWGEIMIAQLWIGQVNVVVSLVSIRISISWSNTEDFQ